MSELKQHVALFLSKHYPAAGNYNEPCSVVANKAIKMFADYIATLPNEQPSIRRAIEEIEALRVVEDGSGTLLFTQKARNITIDDVIAILRGSEYGI
jgi:hypothetical protein